MRKRVTERYDLVAAEHYAAYRPPLHAMLLERGLGEKTQFRSGIDIGCGTGYSAIALAEYCDAVCGIDVSAEMIARAEAHSKVQYVEGGVEMLSSLSGKPFDMVSFAGSLFYTKSEELKCQLVEVCHSDSVILVYDFDVLLGDLLETLGFRFSEDGSAYDHNVGLSDWSELKLQDYATERQTLTVNPKEAAHLLLSDSNRYDAIQKVLGETDLFDVVLARFSGTELVNVEVRTWWKRYHLH
jgi:SAM-dependent methyltransferase